MTNATDTTPTFAPSIRMHHATRTKAWKLQATLAAEYPRLSLVAKEGEESEHENFEYELGGFLVLVDEDEELLDTDKVPELADILDACAEQEIDPSAEDDEDENKERRGSVVAEHYRVQYREASSNGQNCGDWLAETLVANTEGADGKLDVDALTAVFEANGLNLNTKWGQLRFSGQRGWQGRFRMNGRQVLEKIIAKTGILRIGSMDLTPPADWLEDMRSKHKDWLAKQAKMEAAATEAIKSSVEG